MPTYNLPRSWTYNSRLQPNNVYASINNQDDQWLFLEQLGWSAPNTTTNDNGVLQSAVVYEGGPSTRPQMATFTQSFGYDMANRLTAAIDTNWVRTFHYDPYGNMSVSGNSGAGLNGLTPLSQNNIDPYYASNNQLKSGSYDAAGNQAVMGSLSMWRDAENRQYQTWDSITHQQVNYLCDAEGNRVQKTVAGGATTYYVYDALGQLAAEYTGAGVVSKEYIRLGGQLVAVENAAGSPCQTCYLSYDHLGSVRLVTDQNATVVARHEYLPFGEALDGSAGRTGSGWGTVDSVNQRFTGQERDSETGMDFFQARYFGSALGRFISPDDPFADQDVSDPQSWNLYSYVLNNPLRYTDPDGHDDEDNSNGVPTFRATGTGYSGLSPLDELLYRSFFQNLSQMMQLGQQTQQVAQQTFDWLRTRDWNCVGQSGYRGAVAGTGAGMVIGGSAAGALSDGVLAIPGAVQGGMQGGTAGLGAGLAGGLMTCASSTGSGGGGAQPSSGQSGCKEFWKDLKPFRGKTKTNGLQGKARRFFEWDHTHGDVEVYDSRGQHLGSVNPDDQARSSRAADRNMTKYEHCCEQMRLAIDDPDIPIVYTRKFREFGVRILDGGSSTLGFIFCPWCGQKLPESLREAWFDELERLGIDPAASNVPTEFLDESWYRTRRIGEK